MEDQKVTINGKDYVYGKLTDQQKFFVNIIGDTERKLVEANYTLQQLSVAKQSFIQALINDVESGTLAAVDTTSENE